MVRLVYSNRTEELLAELAARVRAQQARDGALAPVRVVVPSANVEGYLRLGIARERGVAANLEFSRLTGLAAEVVEAPPRGARSRTRRRSRRWRCALLARRRGARGARSSRRCARTCAEAGDAQRPDGRAARPARVAHRPALRGVHVLARRHARRRGAAGPRTRRDAPARSVRRDRGVAAPPVARDVRRRRARGARGGAGRSSRCTRRSPRSSRDAASLPRALHVFGFAHVGAGLPRAPRAHRARDRGRPLRAQPVRGLLGGPRRRATRRRSTSGAVPGASRCARSTRSPASTTTTASSTRSTSRRRRGPCCTALQSDVLRREPARDAADPRPRLAGRREPRRPRARERAARARGRRERDMAARRGRRDAALRRDRRARARDRRGRVRRASPGRLPRSPRAAASQ